MANEALIRQFTRPFSCDELWAATGDPNLVGPATAACVVLIMLMVISSLLLLASPYFSYKLAFGQIFEAVSVTAAGWMGALTDSSY